MFQVCSFTSTIVRLQMAILLGHVSKSAIKYKNLKLTFKQSVHVTLSSIHMPS